MMEISMMGFVMRYALGLVLSLVIALSGVAADNAQTTDWVLARSGVDIGALVEVDSWDNHHEVECGGLLRPFPDHYDGDSLDVFECDADAFAQIEGDWQLLPLPENLNRLVYGEHTDSEPPLPEITDGYYLFIDRSDGAENPSDDSLLLDRASISMSLFIYDVHQEMLYYYELDT